MTTQTDVGELPDLPDGAPDWAVTMHEWAHHLHQDVHAVSGRLNVLETIQSDVAKLNRESEWSRQALLSVLEKLGIEPPPPIGEEPFE